MQLNLHIEWSAHSRDHLQDHCEGKIQQGKSHHILRVGMKKGLHIICK